jgi:hypothetical protein
LLLKYLPDESDWYHIDKKWLCDTLYTIDTQEIQRMIDSALIERREHLEEKQHLVVEMKPEFTEALKNSLSVSSKAFT